MDDGIPDLASELVEEFSNLLDGGTVATVRRLTGSEVSRFQRKLRNADVLWK